MEKDYTTGEFLSDAVVADWEKWASFLKDEVDFWHKASDFHTVAHCERVLLFALVLADRKGFSGAQRETLATAAVFHDSRRLDDWTDVGHGRRAADYYEEFCAARGTAFDPVCYEIMAWHDRHDEDGLEEIRRKFPGREDASLLYQVFKDADALDRFRLGPGGLDVRYLRTSEARELYGFAKKVSLGGSVRETPGE